MQKNITSLSALNWDDLKFFLEVARTRKASSAAKRLALKPFAVTFGKAWGYPLLVVESKDRAWALAQDVLDTEVSDVAHF